MRHVYDKNGAFKYTPAASQGHDYLRKKFREIFDAQEKMRAETGRKVVAEIKPRVKAKT